MAGPENVEQKPNFKAYCFITAAFGEQRSILADIKGIPQVKDSNIVAGTYDLVAIIGADTTQELGVCMGKLQKTSGVISTTTCLVLDKPSPQSS